MGKGYPSCGSGGSCPRSPRSPGPSSALSRSAGLCGSMCRKCRILHPIGGSDGHRCRHYTPFLTNLGSGQSGSLAAIKCFDPQVLAGAMRTAAPHQMTAVVPLRCRQTPPSCRIPPMNWSSGPPLSYFELYFDLVSGSDQHSFNLGHLGAEKGEQTGWSRSRCWNDR